MMTQGELVRRTREKFGWKQSRMALEFGVDWRRIGKWENGRSGLGPSAMKILARLSGMALRTIQKLPIVSPETRSPGKGTRPHPKGRPHQGFTRRATDPNLLRCQEILAELRGGQGDIMDHLRSVTGILREVATLMGKAQSLRVTMGRGNNVVTD